MSSNDFLGYGNQVLSVPVAATGVTHPELLASPIAGRQASLTGTARMDFRFPAISGIRMVGADGLKLGLGAPSISFAFSNALPGGSDLGVFTYTPVLPPRYSTLAWVLPTALPVARFMRASFTNCAAVGIVWASPVLNPEYGIQVGASRRRDDLSIVNESDMTGAASAMVRPALRVVGIKFGAIDTANFLEFDAVEGVCGTHRQVMLVPGYGAEWGGRGILHGRLVNLADETHVHPSLMEWPFQIRQSL